MFPEPNLSLMDRCLWGIHYHLAMSMGIRMDKKGKFILHLLDWLITSIHMSTIPKDFQEEKFVGLRDDVKCCLK